MPYISVLKDGVLRHRADKNNGDLPRSIKCSEFKAFQIVNAYISETGSCVKFLTVPMIFNVKHGL